MTRLTKRAPSISAGSLPIGTVVDLFPIVTESLKLIAEKLDELESRLRRLEGDHL